MSRPWAAGFPGPGCRPSTGFPSLGRQHHAELDRRLSEAYVQASYGQARQLLKETLGWLRWLNPDAAASLEEGCDE